MVAVVELQKNTEWRRKDASKKIRSTLNMSFCGEKRFYVQIPDINDDQRHAMGKVRLCVEQSLSTNYAEILSYWVLMCIFVIVIAGDRLSSTNR